MENVLLPTLPGRTDEAAIHRAEKLIDSGADIINFDQVYTYAQYRIMSMGKPAGQTAQNYSQYFDNVVATVRQYAAQKGVQILVTMNCGTVEAAKALLRASSASLEMLDIITVVFNPADFSWPYTTKDDWAGLKAAVSTAYKRQVPIVAFMDSVGENSPTNAKLPLSKFAALRTADQIKVLKKLDASTRAAGVLFAYPVYGGNVDPSGRPGILYDSVRYGTYNTIVALSTAASSGTTLSLSLLAATSATTRPSD
jgi:hypothetical protein